MSVLSQVCRHTLRSRLLLAKTFAASSVVPRTREVTTTTVAHDHASHFKIERYWAAGMLPIFPAAYFIHGPYMDAALTIALTLHIHWGLFAVMQDYARPILIGESAAKAACASVYVISILLLAGLLHFNYNDVGLTRAFELVFSL
uniref:Succinate dehydrogenase [ubiquinone] cytochrome b small subunit n=1 Tax=Acrobeloides nanus TaxID=290746 RepID=A0A914CE34_9BILA